GENGAEGRSLAVCKTLLLGTSSQLSMPLAGVLGAAEIRCDTLQGHGRRRGRTAGHVWLWSAEVAVQQAGDGQGY
ncbi:MAG TPA: hypothetical protein VJP78_14705, partial [Thermoleophilia bacterium]|nr:hypothetical protein [Thermoleophilia bacterium]